MPQVAKDYEDVSARLRLPPSLVHSTFPAFEDLCRCEDFLHFLGYNSVSSDVLDPVKRPFQFIDSHVSVFGNGHCPARIALKSALKVAADSAPALPTVVSPL